MMLSGVPESRIGVPGRSVNWPAYGLLEAVGTAVWFQGLVAENALKIAVA